MRPNLFSGSILGFLCRFLSGSIIQAYLVFEYFVLQVRTCNGRNHCTPPGTNYCANNTPAHAQANMENMLTKHVWKVMSDFKTPPGRENTPFLTACSTSFLKSTNRIGLAREPGRMKLRWFRIGRFLKRSLINWLRSRAFYGWYRSGLPPGLFVLFALFRQPKTTFN